jgi:hypothetical protein
MFLRFIHSYSFMLYYNEMIYFSLNANKLIVIVILRIEFSGHIIINITKLISRNHPLKKISNILMNTINSSFYCSVSAPNFSILHFMIAVVSFLNIVFTYRGFPTLAYFNRNSNSGK